MIDVNELRKGTTFEFDGNLYRVVEYSHNKPGRGKATIRVKLKDLRSGATLDKTFSSGDRVQDIRLDHHTVQYLYNDGELYHFMDQDTYEQPALRRELLEDIVPYLLEGMELKLTFYEQEPLDLDIPVAVEHKVETVDEAVRGDTANSISTRAVTETGLEVQVPAFIKAGDTIKIDTRSGEYITRV